VRVQGPTPAQTVGPFFAVGLCGLQRLVAEDDPRAVRISGILFDGDGGPIEDGVVEIWQADAEGRYPRSGESFNGFGRCLTTAHGEFSFLTVKPGPVGALEAPHLAVSVFARGLLKRLVTRIYFPDETVANASDPVLRSIEDPARRETLIAAGDDGDLRFDIHLQGERETVFFELE
jgi:protocatechuate 3,4-dioxygenase, alpha subunit